MDVSTSSFNQSSENSNLTPKTDYPAYELYTEALRKGIFPNKGRQMKLVVGKDRKVKSVSLL
jgi:hypothetical protein